MAELYLRGQSQHAIARQVGVSQMTVCGDLAVVRAKALADYAAKVAEEVAKVDRLEEEAWDAWHRSCQGHEAHTRRVTAVPRGEPAAGDGGMRAADVAVRTVEETVIQQRAGDPQFLEWVAWCIEARVRLFGLLDNPASNAGQGTVPWDDLCCALENRTA